MLWLGLRDHEDLFKKLNAEKDAEFDRNNFIEYHVFMRKVIECIPENSDLDPNDVLQKVFFDQNADNVDVNDYRKNADYVPDFDNYDRPEKQRAKQPSKSSLKDSQNSGLRDSQDRLPKRASQDKFGEPIKASSKIPKKTGEPYNMMASPKLGKGLPSRTKLGGVNGGAGGDFYIGLDEGYQGDIELFFRSQFTGLIERFIDAVLADQSERTRDPSFTLDEYKANILGVVNRKCQNLLTALFSGNKANFIR